jgi:hypothetical protein
VIAAIALVGLTASMAACGAKDAAPKTDEPPGDATSSAASSPTASSKPKNWIEANCPRVAVDPQDTAVRSAADLAQARCIAGQWGPYLQDPLEGNLEGWNLRLDLQFMVTVRVTDSAWELFQDEMNAGGSPLRCQFTLDQHRPNSGATDARKTPRQVTVSNVRIGTRIAEGDDSVQPLEEVALPNPDPPSLLWQDEADNWNSPFGIGVDAHENDAETNAGKYSLAEFGKLPEVSDYYFDISAFDQPWQIGGGQAIDEWSNAISFDPQERVVTFLLPGDMPEWTLFVYDITVDDSEPHTVATWLVGP